MINKMSHWLDILTHCLDCYLVNDNSWSRSQEGPTRDLTPLGTPQQTKEGKADKTRGTWTTTLTFSVSNVSTWCVSSSHHILTKYLRGYSLQSIICATLTPPTLSLPKVTIRPMDLHIENFFHVSSINRNDYFDFLLSQMLWPSSYQEKKGAIGKEEGTQSKRKVSIKR